MWLISFSFFAAFLFCFLLFTIGAFSNYRSIIDRENSSPFECGFDPKSNARSPFSLRFFLLAVIFLVFDVEIALLIPAPVVSPNFSALFTIVAFLLILFIGLLHEWREGSLNWA